MNKIKLNFILNLIKILLSNANVILVFVNVIIFFIGTYMINPVQDFIILHAKISAIIILVAAWILICNLYRAYIKYYPFRRFKALPLSLFKEPVCPIHHKPLERSIIKTSGDSKQHRDANGYICTHKQCDIKYIFIEYENSFFLFKE